MQKSFSKLNRKTKPNLIPIMDAVFIFIFFLLMSAQFIDIYEINSDAPAVVTIDKKMKIKTASIIGIKLGLVFLFNLLNDFCIY